MTDDSLNWLAMQYVLDELPESERDSFEERLGDDLAACEAVARASRLRQGLEQTFASSNPPLLLPPNPAARVGRSQFAVAAAGVTLACGVFVSLFGPAFLQRQDQTFVKTTDHAITANPASVHVALISMWRSGMSDAETDADEMEDESQELAEVESAPAWLLAGVSLEMNESH